jgi:hypothetical protein
LIVRLVWFVLVVACGTHAPAKKPSVDAIERDAGATWDGEGCATLASRETPIDIAGAVIDGDLHKGKTHCYLDLQRALCVRLPAEDGGTDETYVRTLRLPGNCDNEAEVRMRGSVHGVVEPLGVNHPGDWTVDATPTSLERAKHVVEIDLGDAGSARKELLESFMLRCWRNASVTSSATMGHITLDVVVAPSGEVTDVKRREAVAAPDAFQTCVDKSVRAPQMFLAANTGASREISVRLTFSVAVSPL